MQDNTDDFGAELDAMMKELKKQNVPKAVEKPRPTRLDNERFLKTKKMKKVARKSRRVNRGKRGGKRR